MTRREEPLGIPYGRGAYHDKALQGIDIATKRAELGKPLKYMDEISETALTIIQNINKLKFNFDNSHTPQERNQYLKKVIFWIEGECGLYHLLRIGRHDWTKSAKETLDMLIEKIDARLEEEDIKEYLNMQIVLLACSDKFKKVKKSIKEKWGM